MGANQSKPVITLFTVSEKLIRNKERFVVDSDAEPEKSNELLSFKTNFFKLTSDDLRRYFTIEKNRYITIPKQGKMLVSVYTKKDSRIYRTNKNGLTVYHACIDKFILYMESTTDTIHVRTFVEKIIDHYCEAFTVKDPPPSYIFVDILKRIEVVIEE